MTTPKSGIVADNRQPCSLVCTRYFLAVVRSSAPSCVVVHVADSVDHDLRLIELDVFRTVACEYLPRGRGECKPVRLGQRVLLLIFEVLPRVRRLLRQVADAVVPRGEHAEGPRAE